jgi:hypothetical protein
MQRMGHDSVRAAMIYQHRTREADRRIADAMDNEIRETGQVAPNDDGMTGIVASAS